MPESSRHPRNMNPARAAVPALEAMMDDIERLIFHVVSPYVDDSNPMLHRDELCAECRFKLARIISDGRMQDCPTRGKFFGFLKVSFVNHTRSQVQKHAFTQKRTGIVPRKNCSGDDGRSGDQQPTKSLHLSLNDEDLRLQIAGNEVESRSWAELIEHLETGLSLEEQTLVRHLKTVELPYASKAEVKVPSLDMWEKQMHEKIVEMKFDGDPAANLPGGNKAGDVPAAPPVVVRP